MLQRIALTFCLMLGTAAAVSLVVSKEFTGQNGPIRAVSYTPDGKQLVVSSGGVGYVLDAGTFQPLKTFPMREYDPKFVWLDNTHFNLNGSIDMSSYDLTTGKLVKSQRFDNEYSGRTSLSRNGLYAILVDKEIRLYDVASGIRQKTMYAGDEYLWGIDLNEDGSRLVTAGFDHAALYDVDSGRLMKFLDIGENRPRYATFHESLLAVVTERAVSPRLDVFDSESGEKLYDFPISSASSDIMFSPDGKRIAVPGYERITVYDLDSRKAVFSFDAPTSTSYRFSFSPDGNTLVFGNSFGQLMVADLTTRRVVKQIQGFPGNDIDCLEVSPLGNAILTCGADFTARLLDPRTGQVLRALGTHQGDVSSGAFLPDGQVVTTSMNTVNLWKDGKLVRRTYGVGSYPEQLTAQPNGTLFAYSAFGEGTSSVANVVIEDAKTGKPVAKTTVPGTRANQLAFSKDGSLLAILAESGKVTLWDWKQRKVVATSQASNYSDTLVRSSSGKYFAVVSDKGGVSILDARTLKQIQFVRVAELLAFQFAAQQDRILVSTKNKLTIYDAPSGQRLSEYDSPLSGDFRVVKDGTALIFQSGPAGKPVFATRLAAPDGQAVFR
ncbi:hypothetical protein Dxin01_03392 [Deinococcus xinjiangensis]|uniref:WD40 repeat n=1 Tax=Deinococcus xinjiangensis TaxID=457454 RepID=A0ABP9VJS4_9DEIO